MLSFSARYIGSCKPLFHFHSDVTGSWATIFKATLGVAVDLTASSKVLRDYKSLTVEVSDIHKQLNYSFLGHDFVGSNFDPYELSNELYEQDPTADVQHEDV